MRLFSLRWLMVMGVLLSAALRADPPTLSVRLAVYNPDRGPVRMVLRVENLTGGDIKLRQTTGQGYDFAVYDGDTEIWKWSEGTFFIQALQERVLGPGEILAFSEDWDRRDRKGALVAPGKYTVRGWVPTDAGNVKSEPRSLVLTR